MMASRIRAACLLAIILLSGGCGLTRGQRDGVAAYGKAAETLGIASGEQLQAFRQEVVRMKVVRLAIEGRKLAIPPQGGKIAPREVYARELNLDSGLDPENLDRRLESARLLASYGSLLRALSEKSQEKALSEAADRFAGSIRKFPGNPLSEEQLGGLGQLVTMAGGWWVEREKKQVVCRVVPLVSPLIRKLCEELKRDFDIQAGGFASQVDGTQERLAREAVDGMKRDIPAIADRLVLIEGFAHANDSRDNLHEVSSRMMQAIKSMEAADRNLNDLVDGRKVTIEDIRSYSHDVSELAEAIKPFAGR